MTTRAIILVPGMERVERGARRDLLTENIVTVVANRQLHLGEPVSIGGESGRAIIARPERADDSGDVDGNGGPDRIDVFEAYWADMIPSPSDMGPWRKLVNSLDLLIYWLFRPSGWQAFHISPMISFGLILGAIILVFWYVSLVLVVAQIAAQSELPSGLVGSTLAQDIFERFVAATTAFGNLETWLIAAALLGVVNVEEIIGMARFIKIYFENQVAESQETAAQVGLRFRLRRRLADTLENVLAQPYDEVFVVAHSFGSIIAVDTLRYWPNISDLDRLKFVTLGSPIAVLQYRSTWLREALAGLMTGAHVKEWTDYHASTDWLCAAVPGHAAAFEGHSHALRFEAPMMQRISGRTHMLYFQDERVLSELVSA